MSRLAAGWIAWLLLAPALSFAQTSSQGAPRAQPLRRSAVIVGANSAAPGRKPLRFSERDARAFAEVLVELGGFAASDIDILLDPEPDEVLAALDRGLEKAPVGESMLVFYYSGHADASALFPNGRPLRFSDLRKRFADPRAAIRLGIIDACRGGGWTGAKGLAEVAPFEVTLPMALESQGSVLIASSSGLEDAHESELLGGSFFTHHWNAALRGAGDRNEDGQVTLAEAFDYAKALTIRDTTLHTRAAQHPSFALDLRGRQDLALSTLASASSSAIVAVDQRHGPLELVHLGSGVVLLEVPKGPRTLKLAVAPGEYLLRRRFGGQVWTRELSVRAGETTRIDEEALELQGTPALAVKRREPRPLTRSTVPGGMQEATFWLGVGYQGAPGAKLGRGFQAASFFPRGLTDRLQWMLPALALTYRIGEHGAREWLPWGGIIGWNMGGTSRDGFLLPMVLGAGVDMRQWLTPSTSLIFGVSSASTMRYRSKRPVSVDPETMKMARGARFSPPDTWALAVRAGVTTTLADTVTLQLMVGLGQYLIHDGEPGFFGARSERADLTLSVGGMHGLGLRPMHLVQIHLTDHVALNLDVGLMYKFATRRAHESYLIGASFLW